MCDDVDIHHLRLYSFFMHTVVCLLIQSRAQWDLDDGAWIVLFSSGIDWPLLQSDFGFYFLFLTSSSVLISCSSTCRGNFAIQGFRVFAARCWITSSPLFFPHFIVFTQWLVCVIKLNWLAKRSLSVRVATLIPTAQTTYGHPCIHAMITAPRSLGNLISFEVAEYLWGVVWENEGSCMGVEYPEIREGVCFYLFNSP